MHSQLINVSLSVVNVWFWMMEESNDSVLVDQSKSILNTLFGSIQNAEQYRANLEAEQFLMKNICENWEQVSHEMHG